MDKKLNFFAIQHPASLLTDRPKSALLPKDQLSLIHKFTPKGTYPLLVFAQLHLKGFSLKPNITRHDLATDAKG